MPSRATVEAFVAMVESNQHDAAIEKFYAEDASMQENAGASRSGRDALVAHERKVLAAAKEVRSRCVRPVLVDGDTVVIHWIFDFVFRDGRTLHVDELAHQTWRGEQLLRERFFYDPAASR
jgi:ketosteroid isomerase-like protein